MDLISNGCIPFNLPPQSPLLTHKHHPVASSAQSQPETPTQEPRRSLPPDDPQAPTFLAFIKAWSIKPSPLCVRRLRLGLLL